MGRFSDPPQASMLAQLCLLLQGYESKSYFTTPFIQINTQAGLFSLTLTCHRCFMTLFSVFVCHIFQMTKIGRASLPAVGLSATGQFELRHLVVVDFFSRKCVMSNRGRPSSIRETNKHRETDWDTDRTTDRQC